MRMKFFVVLAAAALLIAAVVISSCLLWLGRCFGKCGRKPKDEESQEPKLVNLRAVVTELEKRQRKAEVPRDCRRCQVQTALDTTGKFRFQSKVVNIKEKEEFILWEKARKRHIVKVSPMYYYVP